MRTAALVTPPRASPGPGSYLRNVIRERVACRKISSGPPSTIPRHPLIPVTSENKRVLAGKFEIVRSTTILYGFKFLDGLSFIGRARPFEDFFLDRFLRRVGEYRERKNFCESGGCVSRVPWAGRYFRER